jgi:hypothetical protein
LYWLLCPSQVWLLAAAGSGDVLPKAILLRFICLKTMTDPF